MPHTPSHFPRLPMPWSKALDRGKAALSKFLGPTQDLMELGGVPIGAVGPSAGRFVLSTPGELRATQSGLSAMMQKTGQAPEGLNLKLPTGTSGIGIPSRQVPSRTMRALRDEGLKPTARNVEDLAIGPQAAVMREEIINPTAKIHVRDLKDPESKKRMIRGIIGLIQRLHGRN